MKANPVLDSHNNQERISSWKAVSLYCIVSFFLFFEMAIQVSPSVMATQLMQDLNIGAFGLGIMSGVYFYTYTAMQIPSGLLFDRYNPRLIITLSILACALGTLLFSLATNVYVGCLARLLMGTGSAFAFVSVLVVTADLFKSKYFATITGITQTLAALGAMTGQMPISKLVSVIGWRDTLLVLFVVGIVLAIVVWTLLKYQRNTHAVGHLSPETSTKTNLKNIVSHSQTWYIALYSCLLWAPMSSFASLWGVPFLTQVNHLDPTSAAFLCSLMWLGLAVASPLLGMISTAANNRVLSLAVSALIGVVSFALVLEFSFSNTVLGLLLFLAGAACSGQALSFTVVKENNPSSIRGTAIAFNNMAVVISGAVFQPVIGKIIALGQINGTNTYDAHHFKSALLIVLGSYVIAFLVALFFIKEPNSSRFE
jgi:MFS family permease